VSGSFVGEVRPRGKVNGRGVEAWDGARLTVRRSSIERASESGVLSLGAGSSVDLEDVVVDETRVNSDNTFGFGIAVTQGGKLSTRRVAARFNLTVGVIVTDPESHAELVDTVIADTDVDPSRSSMGRGLQVQEAATANASRITFARNTEVGAAVFHPSSRLDLAESLVTATRGSTLAGIARGLAVQEGTLVVKDTLVLDAIQAGISVAAEGELRLDHVNVARTKADRTDGFGHGVVADTGRIFATDVQVRKSASVGWAIRNAGASIVRSRVEDNAIGLATSGAAIEERANVPAAPEARKVIVSSDTVFSGNGTRVGSGTLAVPQAFGDATSGPSKP
jgi:hypothetical protein